MESTGTVEIITGLHIGDLFFMLQGAKRTIILTLVSISFGTILGLFIGILRGCLTSSLKLCLQRASELTLKTSDDFWI